jgi:GSH-dependent disulfide-bond oxidoreductase
MIVAYTADTPNGIKLPIALEELGLDYRIVRVALGAGEQKTPEFLAMNPNGRIPVLVDDTGPLGSEAVFESGAILWDLAERYPGLMPADPAERLRALQWFRRMMLNGSG